jgi:nucleotide-binding universal stress UspA family protein
MAGRKVLVPYNFTANDEKALGFVIQKFAADSDVTVTLFNAYTPVPEVQVRNNPIMDKMSANLAYLRQKLREREEELREARNRLVREGFSEDRVDYVFKPLKKDVAREVVDLARKDRFDVVVLNRNPANIKRFFTASVAEKVDRDLKDTEVAVIV